MTLRVGPESQFTLQFGNGATQSQIATSYPSSIATSTYDEPSYTGCGPDRRYGTQSIGTYALLRNTTGYNIQPGGVIAGSLLVYSLTYGTAQEVAINGKSYTYVWRYATGTWRCMGYSRQSANPDPVSLFLRIA